MKQKFFRLFSVLPIYFRPLVGGVSCAVAAAFGSPQSLSVGYATLNRILSGELKNAALLSNFMIGKLIMVAISASSGLIGRLESDRCSHFIVKKMMKICVRWTVCAISIFRGFVGSYFLSTQCFLVSDFCGSNSFSFLF